MWTPQRLMLVSRSTGRCTQTENTPKTHALVLSVLILNYQQRLSDDRVTGWVFCPLCLSVSTFTISLFVQDSTPKSCGLETKGTQTRLINQHSRDYGYLPINQCGGATYNQTNRAGRRAVIQAMMSLSLSLWVLILVVGLWFGVCVCMGKRM